MRKYFFTSLFIGLCVAVIAGQQTKAWTKWTEKEAEQILNDSAWGQTQIDTNIAEMVYSPTTGSGGAGNTANRATMRADQGVINRNRAAEGAYNQAVEVKFRVRFLSAKPIREALASVLVIKQEQVDKDQETDKAPAVRREMQQFIDRDFKEFIVLAVTFEASDGRLMGKAFQDFNSATTASIKNDTYLVKDGGQKLFLIDYRPPSEDGLGARFVFPRQYDGKDFLSTAQRELRFHSTLGPNVKLDRLFKVSDMVYQGKLEY